ncbi:MAG: N-acetylmuramoyl-L-alanine amidase, partial [Clostridia bacterium]
ARAHAAYLKDGAAEAKVSWHYTVDSDGAYQHLPDNESAFHAGDGRSGTGNSQSISMELCVNSDGNFNKTVQNAAELVRRLMAAHDVPIGNVVQHNYWNGKDCPGTIRHTGKWKAFLDMCREVKPVENNKNIPSAWAKAAWDKAIAKKIVDGTRPHEACTREEVAVILDRIGALSK